MKVPKEGGHDLSNFVCQRWCDLWGQSVPTGPGAGRWQLALAVWGPWGSTRRRVPPGSAEGPAQDVLASAGHSFASSSWSRAGGRGGQAGGKSPALGSLV